MKTKILGILVVTLLIGTVVSTVNSVSACTGFTASEGENILVGTNFDWKLTFNVYMHFFPAEEEKFGRVIFDMNFPIQMESYTNNPDWIAPLQGMNDQGLFYHLFWTPELLPVNSSDKPEFYSDDPDYYQYAFWAYCLAKCSTVSEVLEIFDQYNLEVMFFFQVFFVDKYGDSVIIEGDDIVYREGNFQVATNFYQNHPEVGSYPHWRYETAVSMLENMTDLSDEYFRSICSATHQGHTLQSNVYDLNQEMFYVNYYQNYEKTLEFDLNEELEKGERRIHLGSLFEPEDNQPPEKPPAPTGDISGKSGVDYDYRAKTTDPNGDDIMYLFDWGDGSDSGWIMPPVFIRIKATHNWAEKGTYEIKVKAIDQYGAESDWSDPLSVSMPKTRQYINSPFLQFLEQHPHLFPLLRQLLGLQ
jgi:hypothetical protein